MRVSAVSPRRSSTMILVALTLALASAAQCLLDTEWQYNSVSYTTSDTCSPKHQLGVFNSLIACEPKPTLVEVPLPNFGTGGGAIMQVIPGHVMLNRCGGSCHGPSHSCRPVATRNVTVDVMAIQTNYNSGQWNTLCTGVPLVEHTACECSCKMRPENCNAEQFYDASTCSCRCNNQVSRAECFAAGKHWNPSTCSCICPESTWRSCSTGYTFDFRHTCMCVRTYAMASSGLTVLVVVAAILCIGLSGLVYQLKRRRDMFSRNVQKADLAEAFTADDHEDDRS